MDFENCLLNGKAKQVLPNKNRADSLFHSSLQAIDTAKIIPITSTSLKSVLRELYEGLREYCEAIGYLKGYKFQDHESITYFLRDILKEPSLSLQFDRYRRLRNGINYYGDDLELETVKEAVIEIPPMVKKLEKYSHS